MGTRISTLFLFAILVPVTLITTAQAAAQTPLSDAELERLRAIPAWDIESAHSITVSVSAGGGPTADFPSSTSFSINEQNSFVYSFRLTVGGDCTSQPCPPLLSPQNLGELRIDANERHFRRDVNFSEDLNYCQDEDGFPLRLVSTLSWQNDFTSTGGVLVLDGTPGRTANGDFFIDTRTNPPVAQASIYVREPGFPGRKVAIECASCSRPLRPAGCQTVQNIPTTESPMGGAQIFFGPFQVEGWGLTGAPVQVESGRFVIRGQIVVANPIRQCLIINYRDPASCVEGTDTEYISVVIREHEAPAPPPGIHSVEFTQAIQVLQPLPLLKADLAGDGSPPVPIVGGKPAVMRVHFDQASEPSGFTLEVSGGPITASRTGILDPACTPEDRRRQDNGCFALDFYFTPPEGPWSVTLTLKDRDGVEQENHVLNLTSRKSDALVLKAVSVCDAVDAAGNWQCASGSTLQLLVGLLKKIAPTDKVVVMPTGHQVKGRVAAVNGDGDLDDCIDGNANGIDDLGDRCEANKWFQLVAFALNDLFRASEPLGGVPGHEVFYYGMVRPGVSGGTLGIAVVSGRGGASKTSAPVRGIELAPWVVAHETAHMVGREHTNTDQPLLGAAPPGCWLGTSGAPTWPYADNLVRSGPAPGVLEVGFDVQAGTVVDPQNTFDVMGYCAGSNWISPHTTLGMLQVLDPPPTATPTSAAALGQVGSYWRVAGTIESGSASINPIFTFETQGSTEPGSGTHRIGVLGAKDNVLFTRFFTPIAPHISPGPDEPAPEGTPFFSELIPVQANASSIAVIDPSGATLAQVALGGTAPTVNITFPAGGELFQGPETAAWTVTDPDSTNHMFQVHYSGDGGATWRSLTSAESALSLVVDFNDLPGSVGQSLLRVIASDGVNTGLAVSNPFSVVKKQPSAKIIFPSTGASFALGTLVLVQAVAFDADDGLLRGSSLQWSSDVDGPLGSGDDLPVYNLSRGRHTITLTVTDGDGNIATDQVTIFVFDQPTADGDFDGDVDLVDFERVGRCWSGPRTSPSDPACRAFDFDADGDVDLDDVAQFQLVFGPPACIPGTVGCGWEDGDMVTYNQDNWGGDPSTNTAAALLLAQFDNVYSPFGGLEVGITGAAGYSMLFTSASALLDYEPASGGAGILNSDLIDPTSSASGVFGGFVVALQLNVDFSDANLISGTSGLRFGDLRICGLTAFPLLNGMTVHQFLATANQALGGGSNPYTPDDLAVVSQDLSASFESGAVSLFAQQHLFNGACP